MEELIRQIIDQNNKLIALLEAQCGKSAAASAPAGSNTVKPAKPDYKAIAREMILKKYPGAKKFMK